jgi:hypothetical protein
LIPQPLVAASDALQFSLTDLKFFHHFLVVAHPHLPLGNEEVWVQKIPLFAQEVRASKQCVHSIIDFLPTRIEQDDQSVADP